MEDNQLTPDPDLEIEDLPATEEDAEAVRGGDTIPAAQVPRFSAGSQLKQAVRSGGAGQ